MTHLKSFANIIQFLILIAVFFIQCKKPVEYPIEPQIKFIDFKTFDTSTITQGDSKYLIYKRGLFQFSFTDGDADLGEDIEGITETDFYNMFITYYEIQNKDTVQVPLLYYNPQTEEFDTLTFNSIIPNLTPENDSGNGIEGEISDTLFIQTGSDYDTIMFELYIKDRAGHSSNTIHSPLIVREIKL